MVKVIFDGNSLVDGIGSSTGSHSSPSSMTGMDLPAQFSRLIGNNYTVLNYAVNGQKTTEMLDDFDTQIAPLYDSNQDQNFLIAWEITNDISINPVATQAEAIQHIKDYCLKGKTAGFTVILLNVIRRYSYFNGSNDAESFEILRNSINQELSETYQEFADGLVDISELPLNLPDGTHTDDDGYSSVALALKPVFDSLLQNPVNTLLLKGRRFKIGN